MFLLCASSLGLNAEQFSGLFDDFTSAPITSWSQSLIAQADVIALPASDRLPESVLTQASRCKVVTIFGQGTDGVNLELATTLGVVVANTPGLTGEAVADLTMALLLALERRLWITRNMVERGVALASTDILGSDLGGRVLGIVGFGNIGQAVAKRAVAFGMKVRYCTSRDRTVPGWEGASRSFSDLIQEADVLSMHCPLTPATKGLIDHAAIAQLRRGSVLLNTARAAIVVEDALIDGLNSGQVGGAGLDVYEGEPAPPTRLLAFPNVVVTPHIGSATRQTRQRMFDRLTAHLRDVAMHRLPGDIVNRGVLDLPQLRVKVSVV